MSNKIKLGIVGLGRIGMHMAKLEISNFPDLYEIVAVCDLIEDRAKKLGAETGAKMYTDYAEMLKQEDIEMVYVATRSCDHFKHTVMAFEAGKDVLLEKPATISYNQALDLFASAKASGHKLYVHQQRRLEAAFNAVKEVVESGKLGKVFEVSTEQNGFQHRDDWQTISEFGGGQLLNWGPHIIDQSLQLLGTSSYSLQSYLCQETAGGDCEDHLRIRFIGDNNRVVNMSISGATALKEGRSFVVYGDRGAAVYENGVLKLRYINPEQVVPEIISDPGTPGASFGASGTYESEFKIEWVTEEREVNVEGEGCLMQYWKHMYESYRNGTPFFISETDVLNIMRVISEVKAQNKYIMK